MRVKGAWEKARGFLALFETECRRRMGDLAERARSTVTWRIRHAIRRIGQAHPALGRHLANAVRTGLFCSYRPERRIDWRIDSPVGRG